MFTKPLAVSLDYAVMWFLVTFLIGRRSHRTDPKKLHELIQSYSSMDPDAVFPSPQEIPEADFRITRQHSLICRDSLEVSFPSPVQTKDPENNTVRARWVPAEDPKGKPVLIFAPGWIIGHKDPLLFYFGRPLRRRGISTCVIEPPYQMDRTPKGCWNGEKTISGDLVRTFHNIRQAVIDTRVLIRYLRGRGVTKIGLAGLSLGGWITALTASFEADLDYALVGVPPVDLGNIFEKSYLVSTIKEDIRRSEVPLEDVEALSRLVSPLSYPLRVPKERVRLAQSIYDKALPPRGTEDLCRHWGNPILRRYATGHINIPLWPKFMRDFLMDCEEMLL